MERESCDDAWLDRWRAVRDRRVLARDVAMVGRCCWLLEQVGASEQRRTMRIREEGKGGPTRIALSPLSRAAGRATHMVRIRTQ